MKSMKCLFAIVLAAALTLTTGAAGKCMNLEGTYEDNVTLTKENGVLTVSGEGKLEKAERAWENVSEYDNKRVEKIVINEGFTEICTDVFQRVFSVNVIDEVQLPESLEIIGDRAFEADPIALGPKKINIPENVRYIGEKAFQFAGLSEIHIPKNTTYIGNGAFGNLPRLEKITVSEENPMFVEKDNALYTKDMTRLLVYPSVSEVVFEYKIPEGVKEIDSDGLYYADFTNLILPESLISLTPNMFSGMQTENLYIPKTVTDVKVSAFKGSYLRIATYSGTRPVYDKCVTLINNIYYAGSKADWVKLWLPEMKEGQSYEEFENEVLKQPLPREAASPYEDPRTLIIDAIHYGEISVNIDGEYLETEVYPIIRNERMLVPMRAIFEAMGATVTWDDEEKCAIGEKGGVTVKIKIGEAAIYKNGEKTEIDSPAEIVDDRTMVPVRAIAEAFGAHVDWDNETRCVMITE